MDMLFNYVLREMANERVAREVRFTTSASLSRSRQGVDFYAQYVYVLRVKIDPLLCSA